MTTTSNLQAVKRGMSITAIANIHNAWVCTLDWPNKTSLDCVALITSSLGAVVDELTQQSKPSPCLGGHLADLILKTLELANREDVDIDYRLVSRLIANRT